MNINCGKMYWLEDDNGKRFSNYYKWLSSNVFSIGEKDLINAEGENGYGFIDLQGNEVIECCYKQPVISSTDGLQGLCRVDTGLWGFVNNRGVTVIPFIYEDALPFSCELAAVKKNGRWGYINKRGEKIIDFQYRDGTCSFCNICGEERAIVRSKPCGIFPEKFFYIDKSNKKKSRDFDDYEYFDPNTGNRTILCDGKDLIIDKSGNDIKNK